MTQREQSRLSVHQPYTCFTSGVTDTDWEWCEWRVSAEGVGQQNWSSTTTHGSTVLAFGVLNLSCAKRSCPGRSNRNGGLLRSDLTEDGRNSHGGSDTSIKRRYSQNNNKAGTGGGDLPEAGVPKTHVTKIDVLKRRVKVKQVTGTASVDCVCTRWVVAGVDGEARYVEDTCVARKQFV